MLTILLLHAGPPYRFIAGAEGGDTPSASGSSFSDDPKRAVAAQESLHTAANADMATAGGDSKRSADGGLAQGSPRSGSGRGSMPATLEQALRGAATEGERQEWRQHFAGRQQAAAAADDLRTSHLLDSAATTPQPGQSNAKSAAPARSASHRSTCALVITTPSSCMDVSCCTTCHGCCCRQLFDIRSLSSEHPRATTE